MTLQRSQRRLTDALTFILVTGSSWFGGVGSRWQVLDASRGDP
jgi:hypothetical protein